jgi:hypothetical protein
MSKAAKELLENKDTTATACMAAMDEILGSQWMSWEPQSLWIELHRQGIKVDDLNKDQILAARCLITTGRFWYDANVFEKTCISFNNEEPSYDALEDAPIAYIAWAVREANLIFEKYESEVPELDREPVCYTGVQLYREGFVLAPESLSWAQEELDKHLAKDCKELKKQVKQAWAAAPKNELLDAAYPETPVGVQLARLAAVRVYYDSKKQQLLKDSAKLPGPLVR